MAVVIAGAAQLRVRSNGVELAVNTLGDATRPTVVLVHGYPDTKEVWTDVAPALADRFHVVAYDVRGAGESTDPGRKLAGWDYDRLVDDVLAVIDATAPGKAVHLVGHDWGSIQGWEFVTTPRTQGRFLSFTSISGPCIDYTAHWLRHELDHPSVRGMRAVVGQGFRSSYIGWMRLPIVMPLLWRTALGRRWPKVLARRERITVDGGHPASTVARDGARGIRLYRRNIARRMQKPRRDAFAHVPVQLVVATGEPFISPRMYRDLERWVPAGLRRRSIDSGHWVPRSQPERLAGWIAEFVEDVERGEPLRHAANAAEPLVLVTGAGSGIGRATALAFAETGARVLAVDIDGSAAARTAELARALGSEAHAATADVSDAEAMDDLAKSVVVEHGVVDVLVNNAGIGVAGPFLDTGLADWRRTLDINRFGVIHGCRSFGRQMVERGEGGQIINVASAAAFQPAKGLPAYATSKAAVLMLSECLRADFAGSGIGVTAICPGIVNTNITRTTRFVGKSATEQAAAQSKASRLYRLRNFPPEKVADAIVKAARDNPPVVPVTPEAKAAHWASRFAPDALRRLGRMDTPT